MSGHGAHHVCGGCLFFDPDVNNRKTFAVIVDKEKSECYTCYQ